MPNEALFTQGGSYDASELRKLISGIWYAPEPGGVISGMAVSVGPPVSVNVSAGYIYVHDGTGGAYLGYTEGSENLEISSNSGGPSPRVDTIQATISDPGEDETAGTVILSVKIGTSTVDPLSIPIATVTVSTSDVLTFTYPSRKVAEIQNDPNRTSTTPDPEGTWIGTQTIFDSLADRLANIEQGLVADTHDMYVDLESSQVLKNKDMSDASNLFPAAPGVFPPGMVMAYAGSTAGGQPAGWLPCFGQLVSRVTYAALYAKIGTVYGAGDGSTTFGLPDLRGRVVAGVDSMGGAAAGRLTGTTSQLGSVNGLDLVTLVEANLPAHNHMGAAASLTSSNNSIGHRHAGPQHNHEGFTLAETQVHSHSIPAHSHTIDSANANHEHANIQVTGNLLMWQTDGFAAGSSVAAGQRKNGIASTGEQSVRASGANASHTHTMSGGAAATSGNNSGTHTHSIPYGAVGNTGDEDVKHTHSVTLATVGQGTKVSVVQPTMQLNYIIKY